MSQNLQTVLQENYKVLGSVNSPFARCRVPTRPRSMTQDRHQPDCSDHHSLIFSLALQDQHRRGHLHFHFFI